MARREKAWKRAARNPKEFLALSIPDPIRRERTDFENQVASVIADRHEANRHLAQHRRATLKPKKIRRQLLRGKDDARLVRHLVEFTNVA